MLITQPLTCSTKPDFTQYCVLPEVKFSGWQLGDSDSLDKIDAIHFGSHVFILCETCDLVDMFILRQKIILDSSWCNLSLQGGFD